MASDQALLYSSSVLGLRKLHPEWQALELLDHAAAQWLDGAADFRLDSAVIDDLCYPPSPFASVLCEAFAPSLPSCTGAGAPALAADERTRWHDAVVLPFMRRFSLRPERV